MSARGVEELQQTLRAFAHDGGLVLYISHHLDEVVGLCDRVTVMRDGRIVTTLDAKQTSKRHLSDLMVGDVEEPTNRAPAEGRQVTFEMRSVSVTDRCRDVSLTVGKGEVLGIGGLADSGADALALAAFGALRPSAGDVLLDGKRVRFRSPVDAVAAGVAYVPADRDRDGLLLNLSIESNIDLAALPWTSRLGFLNPRRTSKRANAFISRLAVHCRGGKDVPLNLSGGNRQKVAIAKWLVRTNRVVLLHNPTRGVDVGGRAEIHGIINELAAAGGAIVLISDDLNELITISDRIVIMRHGAVSGEFSTDKPLTEKELIGHML
jgi:ABC-type sugar transport system ATPase subunit